MTDFQLSDEDTKALAASLFNRTWQLIDSDERTEADELEMIHSAHASRLHWQKVGGPEQWAIGEWQCARVYCEVGFPESAIFHAQACLEIVESNEMPVWMHASVYEVLDPNCKNETIRTIKRLVQAAPGSPRHSATRPTSSATPR